MGKGPSAGRSMMRGSAQGTFDAGTKSWDALHENPNFKRALQGER